LIKVEAKDYIQTLSYKIVQKAAKTIKKMPQITVIDQISFVNQEAFTHAIDNMANYCEELMVKEIPRRTC